MDTNDGASRRIPRASGDATTPSGLVGPTRRGPAISLRANGKASRWPPPPVRDPAEPPAIRRRPHSRCTPRSSHSEPTVAGPMAAAPTDPAPVAGVGVRIASYSRTKMFLASQISLSSSGQMVTLTSPIWALRSRYIQVRDWPMPPPMLSGISSLRIAW